MSDKALQGVFTGSQVLMRSGEILPVELVNKGDQVVTHTGTFSKVKERKQRRYSGTYLVFETSAPFTSLRVVPSNRLLTFPYYHEPDPIRKGVSKWLYAGDITVGQHLLIPWPAAKLNPDYAHWLNASSSVIVEPPKGTTALGVVCKIRNIGVLEETGLVAHRLLLTGTQSFIASGAASQA